MKLYHIRIESDLKGKTIKDTFIGGIRNYADYQIIITTDGGMFVTEFNTDDIDDDSQLVFDTVFEGRLKYLLANDDKLKSYLESLGVTTAELEEFAVTEFARKRQQEEQRARARREQKYAEAKAFIKEYEENGKVTTDE